MPPAAVHHGGARKVAVIVTPFAPRGGGGGQYSGKIHFIWPQGVKETCAGCPQQRYTTGEPGKVQGRDRVGILEGPVGSVFGENSFYRETRGARREGHHVA